MESWEWRLGTANSITPPNTTHSPHASHPSTSAPSGPQSSAKVSFGSKCKTLVSLGPLGRKRSTSKTSSHSVITSPPPSSTHPAPQAIAKSSTTSKLKARVTRSLGRASDASEDVAFTALQILRDSSDAFPPLKSAVGGVMALWQTAKTIKSLEEDGQSFAVHVSRLESALREVLSDTDPATLPGDLIQTVDAITSLLLECTQELSKDADRSSFKRVLTLNRTKDTWSSFRVRFSQGCDQFSMQAAAITFARVARIQEQNIRLQSDMKDVKNRVVLIHEWTTQAHHLHTAYVCFF